MIYQRLTEMAAVMGLVLLALGYLAIRGWRSKAASQSKVLPELPPEFPSAGPVLSSPLYYVVTTMANEPLDRIMRFGLGNRGNAKAELSAAGLVIQRSGENTLNLSASAISAIGTASATIDKAVERDGLVVVTWGVDGTNFDTYLRVLNRDFREQLLASFKTSNPTQKVD
ncbi:MAG: hypothetical protein KGL41_05665 [Actinomycetales bacterium]|nr:hypothetical protein [Actinomycetales bacterium]